MNTRGTCPCAPRHRSDVLLIDEPFAALDAQTRDLMQVSCCASGGIAQTVLFSPPYHEVSPRDLSLRPVDVMTKSPGLPRRFSPSESVRVP